MNLNPEFQRQLYLEYSEARLIGVPLVLWVVFSIGYFIDDHQLSDATARIALITYLLITLLWGARQTMDSILDEYREHTWDTQRMSALHPWELVWGKLFGSTAMVWYAGSICLLVYSLADEQAVTQPMLLIYCIAIALLAQSTSLLLALIMAQRNQYKSSSILMLALIGYLFAYKFTDISLFSTGRPIHLPNYTNQNWYGLSINAESFQQLSLVFTLFWSYVGNYRLMAQALGIRTRPWVWLVFLIFLIVYFGGLAPASSYYVALAGYAVCGVLTYIGLLAEPADVLRLKHLLDALQQKNWPRLAEETPIWVLSFLSAIPFALHLELSNHPIADLISLFHFFPVAILLLLLRDCALYLFFSFGGNPQRALTLTLLSAGLLYGIIPGILSFTGLAWLSALVFPLWADSADAAIICALLQTSFVLMLLYQRWRKKI